MIAVVYASDMILCCMSCWVIDNIIIRRYEDWPVRSHRSDCARGKVLTSHWSLRLMINVHLDCRLAGYPASFGFTIRQPRHGMPCTQSIIKMMSSTCRTTHYDASHSQFTVLLSWIHHISCHRSYNIIADIPIHNFSFVITKVPRTRPGCVFFRLGQRFWHLLCHEVTFAQSLE